MQVKAIVDLWCRDDRRGDSGHPREYRRGLRGISGKGGQVQEANARASRA
jgi:hypothetical protein